MRSLRWRSVGLALAVVVCLLPMAAWYVTHPERNAQIVSAYRLSADSGTPWVTAAGAGAAKYLNLYWLFFDPAYLFVSGDPSLINSTRTSGLFPIAFAVLIPAGLVALVRRATPIAWTIAGGFFAAPLVSVISGAIEMNRVMFAIPFAVLVATFGALALWQARSIAAKALAAVLVLSIGWQFSTFYRDYTGTVYRASAAPWFSGNVREAVRELIGRAGDGADIYLSTEIEWVHRMWRFYAIEAGRLELMSRTTYVAEPPIDAAPGARMLCPAESARCGAAVSSGLWRRAIVVPSFDGSHSYAILERTADNQAN